MMLRRLFTFLFCLLLCNNSISQTSAEENPNQLEVAKKIQSLINAHHASSPKTKETLRIIYFRPQNMDPQTNYQKRIEGIMLDIQEFYRAEMERNGFGAITFPLEMENGKLKIHMVEGKRPVSFYGYESGREIRNEVVDAVSRQFDLDRSTALIFHGLCQKKGDNKYKIFAPYYGSGTQWSGLCHAADCELLDIELLKKTNEQIDYTEHTGRFVQNLAKFNTKYIGGTAHELGHALSLPHNGQLDDQKKTLGTALMGSGNHTYRQTRWNNKIGSFLTFASATRLASHPLFTRSNKNRFEKVEAEVTELKFDQDVDHILINGKLTSSLEPYAVVAYADPDGRNDYDCYSGVALVENGEFHLRMPYPLKSKQQLRLQVCLVNGAVVKLYEADYNLLNNGRPSTDRLSARFLTTKPEWLYLHGQKEKALTMTKKILESDDLHPEAKRRLEHVLKITEPEGEFKPPKEIPGEAVLLSRAKWKIGMVGWGKPARDKYDFGSYARHSLLLETDGRFFESGMYAHAPSNYTFELDGQFKRFTATGGLQSGVGSLGRGLFIIKGDGKELFRSNVLRGRGTAKIDVDIAGIKKLELIVESGKKGYSSCWTIWGAPTVHR